MFIAAFNNFIPLLAQLIDLILQLQQFGLEFVVFLFVFVLLLVHNSACFHLDILLQRLDEIAILEK